MLLNKEYYKSLEEVFSTNEEIKSSRYAISSYITAKSQLNGKGRNGKKWFDLGDEKIIFSGKITFFKPDFAISLLPLFTGRAVLETLKKFFPEKKSALKLKWPNDIYLEKNKIAGILVETEIIDSKFVFIIGIGINLTGKKTEQDFSYQFLSEEKIGEVKIKEILNTLVGEINQLEEILISNEKTKSKLNELFYESLMNNATVNFTWDNKVIQGKSFGFDENGFLKIISEEKIYTLMDSDSNFGLVNE